MNILYLSTLCSAQEYQRLFSTYGAVPSHAGQKFNSLIVRGLMENGCAVVSLSQRIIYRGGENDLHHEDEYENGVHYKYLPRCKGRMPNRILTIFSAAMEIVKWCKKNPQGIVLCDTIQGELSIALWLTRVFRRNRSVAVVTDVPTIRAGEKRRGILKALVYIKTVLISTFDGYIFLTKQMSQLLNPKAKPHVVVEGITDKRVLETPNELDKKYPDKVCMMAGLLEDIFGVDILLDAFERIECPEARLLFYGKGSAVQSIKKAAERDSRIRYCGELTHWQIVEEEKKATLLINPRPAVGAWTAYSFPSKNMEYIASGTPLVAFHLPCIPDEYKPYYYQVDANKEDGLEEVLRNLLKQERTILHSQGLRAQKWIVQSKNSKISMMRVLNMLNQL